MVTESLAVLLRLVLFAIEKSLIAVIKLHFLFPSEIQSGTTRCLETCVGVGFTALTQSSSLRNTARCLRDCRNICKDRLSLFR
jgi:hypothetical protein